MQGVRKQFGGTIALDGVDLSVRPGEVYALIGENGAGKSTLMKILSGAISADAGEMKLDGEAFAPRNPLDSRRAGVAMIYQELSLAPHLSVADNIMLGMEPSKFGLLRKSEARRIVEQALAQFDHPEIQPDTRVMDISVAARQLVEIARGLAIGCRVLVLDEPTSSLTQKDIQKLFVIINRLKTQGLAVVYISHFLEEVKQIADRFTVLRDGRTAGHGVIANTSIDQIVEMMIGRQIEELYPRSPRKPGEVVLSIKEMQGANKLESASLELRRGEVLGIAGLVGAGRTDLLRTLFGLDPVKKGEIKVGAYFGPASPNRRWLQSMGMLSENRASEGLAVSLSITDNLTMSKLTGFGPMGLIIPSRQAQAARKWISELGIRTRSENQKVSELSGGNQQKVAIGRLLHHDVDVLLLDEPTRGIDVASKAQIYKLIDQLVSETARPKAILMVSSYLPELLGICDRIAVMCRGRLGAAHPVNEVDDHKLMLEATGQSEVC
jgi:ribose transport system ATP-binding protein